MPVIPLIDLELEMPGKLIRVLYRRKRVVNKGLVVLAFSLLGVAFGLLMINGRKQEATHPIRHKRDSEIGKQLVLVAVMTSAKFVHTRLPAIMNTWFAHVPGKVMFFSSERTVITPDIKHMPIVRLRGVADTYPPQKKSFVMLKYIYEMHGDDFEWFMRVDDDIYVKAEQLRKFLKSMDSRNAYFIGQPGTGLQAERGRIGLGPNDNFCMGGPGMIISKETLQRFVPHIQDCLLDLRSHHEDVEVGRCIHRWANVSCTWNYEMLHILYNNPKGTDGFRGTGLHSTKLTKAISLHPIKDIPLFHKVHYTLLFHKLQYLQKSLQIMKDEFALMSTEGMATIPKLRIGPSDLAKSRLSYFKCDDCNWEYITAGSLYAAVDAHPVRGLPDVHRQAVEAILDHYSYQLNLDGRKLGRYIDNMTMLNGHVAACRNHAFLFVLDITYKHHRYRSKKSTRLIRKRIAGQIPLFSRWRIETTNIERDRFKTVNFIVPCYGRPLMLKRFLQSFNEAFGAESGNVGTVTLTVIASTHKPDVAEILSQARDMPGKRFKGCKVSWCAYWLSSFKYYYFRRFSNH